MPRCGHWGGGTVVLPKVWICLPPQAQCRSCAKLGERRRFATPEQIVAVEVALFGIAMAFATWPDRWTHKHYYGPPVGNICSCGVCIHGIQVKYPPVGLTKNYGWASMKSCVTCTGKAQRPIFMQPGTY